MAVTNRKALVLTGVSVVRDVVTVTMANGLNAACAQLSASPISTRPPSQWYPQAEQQTGRRHDHADLGGMDQAAYRAGRPGCREGFLASRNLAIEARVPERRLPSFAKALASRLSKLAKQGLKQAIAGLVWQTPAGRALLVSTRG
jgi:hypothetical protein